MALSKRKKAMYMRYAMYVVSIAFLIAVILFIDWERLGNAMFRWNIVKEQFPDILTKAAKNTVVFTVLGFAGGLSFGLLLLSCDSAAFVLTDGLLPHTLR